MKLSISTLTTTAFGRLSAWAASRKLTNWAGNIEYSTERLVAANTVAQVKEFVAKHAKFKVLGTRHCFNRRGTTF
jgi:xylitol oxidase